MTTLIFAFLAMLIIAGIMAVGLYFGRAPIKGSCGGMSAVNGMNDANDVNASANRETCAICGRVNETCDA